MITPIVNRPALLHSALLATEAPVIIDLETTGLTRQDRVVSVGLLVDGQPHILFLRSRAIPNVDPRQAVTALGPLTTRVDLVVVGHNLGFDLGFLHREGVAVNGICHCTEALLRLVDSDRGKNKHVLSARIDRAAPPGAPRRLNYRLKDVVGQLLGLRMVGYDPGTPMDTLAYARHVTYLTSDLIGTACLYEYLLACLTPGQARYHASMIAPLTPILVAMTEVGVVANTAYLRSEANRLRRLIDRTSAEHNERFGRPLGMNGQVPQHPERFSKVKP